MSNNFSNPFFKRLKENSDYGINMNGEVISFKDEALIEKQKGNKVELDGEKYFVNMLMDNMPLGDINDRNRWRPIYDYDQYLMDPSGRIYSTLNNLTLNPNKDNCVSLSNSNGKVTRSVNVLLGKTFTCDMFLDTNIWRDSSLEGYKVSRNGEVYSIKQNRYISQNDNGNGYLFVALNENNKSVYKYIHRLVAEAFIPNENNSNSVIHLDGNKYNNCVENLAWR